MSSTNVYICMTYMLVLVFQNYVTINKVIELDVQITAAKSAILLASYIAIVVVQLNSQLLAIYCYLQGMTREVGNQLALYIVAICSRAHVQFFHYSIRIFLHAPNANVLEVIGSIVTN